MYDDPYYIDKKIYHNKRKAKRIASRIASVVPKASDHEESPSAWAVQEISQQKHPIPESISLYDEIARVEAEIADQKKIDPKWPEDPPIANPTSENKRLKMTLAPIAKILAIMAVIAFVVWAYGSDDRGDLSDTVEDADSDLTPQMVLNGHVLCPPSGERVAPLKINTDGDTSYYVVLVPFDAEARENGSMSFYVSGNGVETDVPLGEYIIYYACGETWYGIDHKFGANTAYFQCEDTFQFSYDDSGYNGWELTLYKVSGGNMSSDEISPESFPAI